MYLPAVGYQALIMSSPGLGWCFPTFSEQGKGKVVVGDCNNLHLEHNP